MIEQSRKHSSFVLIGYMGTGKTTISLQLGEKLELPVLDTDAELVKRIGMSIAEYFQKEGEEAFRNQETELLRELSETSNSCILSCGGGIVLREENRKLLSQCGTVIWLTASPETVFERVRKDTGRPLLNGNMTVEHISEMMRTRDSAYRDAAEFKVETDGKDAEEICHEILCLR